MSDTLNVILETKLIAISRGLYGRELASATLALYRGGVRAFEAAIVQNAPIERSLECIRLLAETLPQDAVVGAGTVLDPAQLKAAYEAGARFAVSPNTDKTVIEETKRLGMVSVPGALTPTEIASAYGYGADIVKVFPAGVMGVEYFKQVKAPLAHIPMAAVGGLSFDNITAFSQAGAAAFGISGSLYDRRLIDAGEFMAITAAAERYRELLAL